VACRTPGKSVQTRSTKPPSGCSPSGNSVLSDDKRQPVANVAVYGFVPQWFYTAKLRLQIMPEDEARARP
jgi:hypothetical protein